MFDFDFTSLFGSSSQPAPKKTKPAALTIHLALEPMKKDIALLASGLRSAAQLRDQFCAKNKRSVWSVLGICKCGVTIAFDAVAIWKNGAVLSVHHDLDESNCPHCNTRLSAHATTYHRIDRHRHEVA